MRLVERQGGTMLLGSLLVVQKETRGVLSEASRIVNKFSILQINGLVIE